MVNGKFFSVKALLVMISFVISILPGTSKAASGGGSKLIPEHPEKKVGEGSWLDKFYESINELFGIIRETIGNLLKFRKEAYGESTPVSPLTEEQKKDIICKDPIYKSGTDECKEVTASSVKPDLGPPPSGDSVIPYDKDGR